MVSPKFPIEKMKPVKIGNTEVYAFGGIAEKEALIEDLTKIINPLLDKASLIYHFPKFRFKQLAYEPRGEQSVIDFCNVIYTPFTESGNTAKYPFRVNVNAEPNRMFSCTLWYNQNNEIGKARVIYLPYVAHLKMVNGVLSIGKVENAEFYVETKVCPCCGANISKSSSYCVGCGKVFDENFKIIHGNNVYQSQDHMHSESMPEPVQPSQTNIKAYDIELLRRLKEKKNKQTVFLLCLFFGLLGIHKFYEGKIGAGLLYLFTFGLFGIGWIHDLIEISKR